MNAPKLSKVQIDALRYYAEVEVRNAAHREGKKMAKSGLKCPDPRPVARLCDLGLLQNVGYNYGAVFGLTEAGRAFLKTLGA